MSSVKFYCFSPMEKAIVHSYSSNVHASYPILNAKDYNRNTYTRGDAATYSFSGSYDLGSAISVDALICHISNYKVSDQGIIDVYYSDNGTMTGGSATFVSGSASIVDTTKPLRIREAGMTAAGAHRYWRFTPSASGGGATPSFFSIIAFAKLFTLPTIHQANSDESLPYAGDFSQSKNLDIRFLLKGRRPVKEFSRTYIINSDANLAILQNVWQNAFGCTTPIVMVEDNGVVQPPIMVKFARQFSWRKIRHQLYQVDCAFVEVPFIDSGESF